jgi:hypothetical protein
MIQNKALANRLNAVRKGESIPQPINEDKNFPNAESVEQKFQVPEFPSVQHLLLSSLLTFGEIAIMSFLYGFGIKVLFSQNWGILGILGVGLLVNQIFSLIASLKLFK